MCQNGGGDPGALPLCLQTDATDHEGRRYQGESNIDSNTDYTIRNAAKYQG